MRTKKYKSLPYNPALRALAKELRTFLKDHPTLTGTPPEEGNKTTDYPQKGNETTTHSQEKNKTIAPQRRGIKYDRTSIYVKVFMPANRKLLQKNQNCCIKGLIPSWLTKEQLLAVSRAAE